MQECASSVPDPVFPRDVVEIETNAGCGGWSSQPFMDILISGDGERERSRSRGKRYRERRKTSTSGNKCVHNRWS